jgi:anti-sigma28 factor (negative regulator of flagellin synthesis)
MQIHGTATTRTAGSGPPRPSGKATPRPKLPASRIAHISEAGRSPAAWPKSAIRADRVQELRAAILNGSYETEQRLSTAVDRLPMKSPKADPAAMGHAEWPMPARRATACCGSVSCALRAPPPRWLTVAGTAASGRVSRRINNHY